MQAFNLPCNLCSQCDQCQAKLSNLLGNSNTVNRTHYSARLTNLLAHFDSIPVTITGKAAVHTYCVPCSTCVNVLKELAMRAVQRDLTLHNDPEGGYRHNARFGYASFDRMGRGEGPFICKIPLKLYSQPNFVITTFFTDKQRWAEAVLYLRLPTDLLLIIADYLDPSLHPSPLAHTRHT